MKRSQIIFFILLMSIKSIAQPESQKVGRTIEVFGYAYEEVFPNAVFASFVLKEYKDENGKSIPIVETEKQLNEILKKLNCKKNTLSIGNIYGYVASEDEVQSEVFKHKMQYIIKLESLKCVNQFLDKIDKRALESFNIDGENYENSDSLNLAIQIRAFNKAKNKADKLLAVYGKNRGEVLEIKEIFGSLITPDVNGKGSISKNLNYASGINYNSNEKTISNMIRVEYLVKVVFEIRD